LKIQGLTPDAFDSLSIAYKIPALRNLHNTASIYERLTKKFGMSKAEQRTGIAVTKDLG